jgi:hypothetical protein
VAARASRKSKVFLFMERCIFLAAIGFAILEISGPGFFEMVSYAGGHCTTISQKFTAGIFGFGVAIGDGAPNSTAFGIIKRGFYIAFGFSLRNPLGFIVMASYWIWSLFLFAAGLASLMVRRKFRKRRNNQSHCPICNYDLRAHHPGQKCPECGTPIPRFGWSSPKR